MWFAKHKKLALLIVVILAAVSLFIRNANKPPQLEKTTVSRGTVNETVEASGNVLAKKTINLSFPNPGQVVWVGVKKGDKVFAWQAVASMDQRSVQNSIKGSLLSYLTARANFDQTQDDNNIHGRNLQDVGLTDAQMRIVEKSQYGLDQAVLDVESANLAREQAVLISPIAGTVTNDGGLVAGQWLTAANIATSQVTVTDVGSYYFQANVDEIDFAKIKVGERATVTLDSFPATPLTGKIAYVGKEGIKKTGGGVQIPVEITFDNIPSDLVSNLNGDAEITADSAADVLTLDKQFVHKNGENYTVNLWENNKIASHPVTVGLTGLSTVEITSGLTEGQEVVNPAQ